MTATNAFRRGFLWKCSREFSSSCVQRSVEHQGRMLAKMLSARVERKIQASANARHAVKLLDHKRIPVLQKLYMRNITEALCFGGINEIDGLGLQITSVSVKDTRAVQVFWVASDDKDPNEVQNILNGISGKVRNHLMFANMMGNVPLIVFKQDMTAWQVSEVQKCLNLISANEVQQQVEEIDLNIPSTKQELEPDSSFPPMKMDVFGLHHDKIFNRIKEAKYKSFPLQITLPPSKEEFANLLQDSIEASSKTDETQIKTQKEVKRFVALYKKSVLHKCRSREPETTHFSPHGYDQEDSDTEMYHIHGAEDDWDQGGDSKGDYQDFEDEFMKK